MMAGEQLNVLEDVNAATDIDAMSRYAELEALDRVHKQALIDAAPKDSVLMILMLSGSKCNVTIVIVVSSWAKEESKRCADGLGSNPAREEV